MCSTFLLNGAGSMTYSAHVPGGVYKPTYGCSQTDHGSFMTGSWFVSQLAVQHILPGVETNFSAKTPGGWP